ncbi:hydrolase [Arhodomonas sp. SL1]|uniref:hydrolase n=1 Tax=Arhodomonas sp. SL1 TaxID=3425691 RepID=UPI003F8852D0
MSASESVYAAAWEQIDAGAAASLATVEALAGINSGSLNAGGVRAVAERALEAFAGLGAEPQWRELVPWCRIDDDGERRERTLGPLLHLHRRVPGRPSVLLLAHTDTVFPPEHPFQAVWREGERLRGPGVADLKGGLVVMRDALRALESGPMAGALGWEVILNPDEEIGSPCSAPALAEAASRHDIGLVFEPAMPDGTLAGARRGSGNWTVVFEGRGAHAGRAHHEGRNAVAAAARLIAALDGLNGERDGVTVNPAFVHGGGPTNMVPERAMLRFNVRVAEAADAEWVEGRIAALVGEAHAPPDYRVHLEGGFSRPPKPMTAAQERLFTALRRCGDRMGEEIDWRPTGGCCDGNNLAAAGLPNIDTLGVVGGGIHTSDEYLEIPSLTRRAQLVATLLIAIAAGEVELPKGKGQ